MDFAISYNDQYNHSHKSIVWAIILLSCYRSPGRRYRWELFHHIGTNPPNLETLVDFFSRQRFKKHNYNASERKKMRTPFPIVSVCAPPPNRIFLIHNLYKILLDRFGVLVFLLCQPGWKTGWICIACMWLDTYQVHQRADDYNTNF